MKPPETFNMCLLTPQGNALLWSLFVLGRVQRNANFGSSDRLLRWAIKIYFSISSGPKQFLTIAPLELSSANVQRPILDFPGNQPTRPITTI